FAGDCALQSARLIDRKHLDRQLLITAQSKCCRVHDFEAAYYSFVEADTRITCSGWILVGIGAVYTINLGRLQDDFSPDFGATQGGGGICCEKWVACACGKNDYFALFEIAQGFWADIGFYDLIDIQG